MRFKKDTRGLPIIPRMVDVIPEGESGNVRVDHYTPSGLQVLRPKMVGQQASTKPVARLIIGNTLVMSDGDDERRSNRWFCTQAQGDVLIAGLGIGMILTCVGVKKDVRRITVVESNPDVVRLVEPAIRSYLGPRYGRRLEIIESDIRTWKPDRGVRFDTIYFDIWPDICTDNLPDISRLHRRFKGRKRSANSFMESWLQERLRYYSRVGR